MGNLAFRSQLRRLFLTPVLGLSTLALVLGFAVYRLQSSAHWVDHSDRAIASLNNAQRLMLDEDDGIRGYLLTGDTEFLAPENASTLRIRSELRVLQDLVKDNLPQQQRVEKLVAAYAEWEKTVLPLANAAPVNKEALATLARSREQMDDLRRQMSDIRISEERLRAERAQYNNATIESVYSGTSILTLMTGLGIAIWTMRTTRRMNDDYQQRMHQEQQMRIELQDKSELVDLAQAAAHAGFWQIVPSTGNAFLTPGCRKLFGLDPVEEVTAQQVLDHIDPADREQVQADMKSALESGRYYSEFRVLDESGETRWLAGQGRLLRSWTGEPYVIGINVDITSQKLAEEALMQNEKLAVVGRLAATISHEINNPLEAVMNLLYLIGTSTSLEEQRKYAKLAQEELSRVSHVVSHTLKFHRQSSNPSLENPATLLDSAAALFQGRLLDSRITLERTYGNTAPVRCYASEMRQVFANLIGNAFDATRSGGRIILRTAPCTDWRTGEDAVRITIADTGIGMNTETRRRLFEPFFTTKGINGTGLGLWVSAAILDKHRARLKIKSRQEEGCSGTVFSIVMPLAAVGATEASGGVLAEAPIAEMRTH